MQSVTFNEALDAIESLSIEDQEALVAILQKRLIDRRRAEIAAHMSGMGDRTASHLRESRVGIISILSLPSINPHNAHSTRAAIALQERRSH